MRFAETVDQLLADGPVREAPNETGGPDERAAAGKSLEGGAVTE